jgi:hypothetical protein
MGEGNGPGKSDRIATIEALKEKKGIMTMSLQQEVFNKPEPKVRFRDSSSRDPIKRLA